MSKSASLSIFIIGISILIICLSVRARFQVLEERVTSLEKAAHYR